MVTTANRCRAVNRRGEPCQAYTVAGSSWCFWHDPERAAERKEARSRGGLARHGRKLAGGDPVQIRSVADLLALLEAAAGDLLALEPSIGRARALAYLVASGLRVLEVGELERRIGALEEVTGCKKN